jgi:hypothetical protein
MTTEAQDIRVWARSQGMEVSAKGPIPGAVMDKWSTREAAPSNGEAFDGEIQPEGPPGGDTAETRPQVTGGLLSGWKRKKKEGQVGRPAPRRVSIENIVSFGWTIGAQMLAGTPKALPVARVLDMQAPVAGIVINEAAKGTVLDKALQPLARAGDKGEKAMALLGPPVIVAAISAKPELYPVLYRPLKFSIMSWLEVSEPAMKKAEARAKKFEEKFGGLDVDAMIQALFAPAPAGSWPEADPEQEEANIRKAKGDE